MVRLLVLVVLLTTASVASSGITVADHTPAHGTSACANAPNVAELPADDRATIAALDGVVWARGSACGEPHPEERRPRLG